MPALKAVSNPLSLTAGRRRHTPLRKMLGDLRAELQEMRRSWWRRWFG
jgi:hypothetical protein